LSGNLHREHAARRQRRHETLQHVQMLRHPLEQGIGEEKIGARFRLPGAQITFDETRKRISLARLRQHVRR
jgi:hypothetical protein